MAEASNLSVSIFRQNQIRLSKFQKKVLEDPNNMGCEAQKKTAIYIYVDEHLDLIGDGITITIVTCRYI